jgi:uncharacterized protein VirK/YbjX
MGKQTSQSETVASRACRSVHLNLISNYFRIWKFATMKEASLRIRTIFLLRSSRLFLFYRRHIDLCTSDTYSKYAAPAAEYDLFRHLSRRFYLRKGLNLRQRVQCALHHYRYEDESFGAAYKQRVYRRGGLLLWRKIVDGVKFEIRLILADIYAAEGEISVALTVDNERLHSISFSWVSRLLAGSSSAAIFIAANQGRWRKDHEFHDKFNSAFPQSAPNFACYAALQGLALAVGATEMRAVSSRHQVCYLPDNVRHFENAYDGFWQSVGGVALPSCDYVLPVPQPTKPLSEVPAKHRKRALTRRVMLNEISDAAKRVIAAHFHGTPLQPVVVGSSYKVATRR